MHAPTDHEPAPQHARVIESHRAAVSVKRRALLALPVLMAGSCTIWAPDGVGDGNALNNAPSNEVRSMILVAHPRLASATYSRSVLVVMPAGGDRHVGLILNRATPMRLANLYPNHQPSRKVEGPVFLGGPAARNSLVAIARKPADPGEGALAVTNELFLVTRATAIDAIIEKSPNDARFYVGQVRWRGGELRSELDRKLWYVLPAEATVILSNDTTNLWRDLMRRLHTLHTARAQLIDAPKTARGR